MAPVRTVHREHTGNSGRNSAEFVRLFLRTGQSPMGLWLREENATEKEHEKREKPSEHES